jgi:hypothetical protein
LAATDRTSDGSVEVTPVEGALTPPDREGKTATFTVLEGSATNGVLVVVNRRRDGCARQEALSPIRFARAVLASRS